MGKYIVTGPFEIGSVAKGGTVELDESVVNVPALLEARLVEPVPAKPAKPKGESR